MLFDFRFLLERPGIVLGALAIILAGKPPGAVAIVALLGSSARVALTVAVSPAQVGEFTFILADAAQGLGILPQEGSIFLRGIRGDRLRGFT